MEKDEIQLRAEKYRNLKAEKKPGQTIMSFSSNCNSKEDCMCWRCMVNKDQDPDIFTEKIAEVNKLISMFHFYLKSNYSSDEEKRSDYNWAITNLKIQAELIDKL